MNVNKVHLVGRVGGDPKIGETSRGETMATISLATNSGYGDNEKTDWHRVKFFGKIADTVNEYVKKGQELYAEGRISYSKYTDKSGVEKYSTDIIAYSMQMGKKSNSVDVSSTSESVEDDPLPF
jgi:single-strand DNA-binding protein|tara:strand:+ start:408 stop:779 length:372 start_codon:yes stop_codon:yes gene_type:complete